MSNSLLDFAEHQRSLGREVTPELVAVGREIEKRKEAKYRYEHRDLWCRIGLHSQIPSVWGGWYRGTCVKCWRELL